MKHSTRQRVVGSVVLILAAVIILPAVLDGDGVMSPVRDYRIPARPQAPQTLNVSPQRPVVTADTPAIRVPSGQTDAADVAPRDSADSTSTNTDTAPAPAADSAPRLDERGLPEAWSVQLGAFSNQANVSSLLARLRDGGHPAYTQSIASPSGALTGVFVGPLVDRGAALALQGQLQQEFELSGRVVRYRIEQR